MTDPHLKFENYPTSSMKLLTHNVYKTYFEECDDSNIESSMYVCVKIHYFHYHNQVRFILNVEESTDYWCIDCRKGKCYYYDCGIGSYQTNYNYIKKYLGTDILDASIMMEIINYYMSRTDKHSNIEELISEIVYRYNYTDIFNYFDSVLIQDIKPIITSYLCG